MMGQKTRKKRQIAARRAQVSELYYGRRLTQQEIAKRLEVDQATVSRDISFLDKQWKEIAKGPPGKVKGAELAELAAMENDAAMEYLRTRDVRWMTERRQIKRDRAKLLGLDAPTKVAPTDPSGKEQYKPFDLSGLDDDDLDKLGKIFTKVTP